MQSSDSSIEDGLGMITTAPNHGKFSRNGASSKGSYEINHSGSRDNRETARLQTQHEARRGGSGEVDPSSHLRHGQCKYIHRRLY